MPFTRIVSPSKLLVNNVKSVSSSRPPNAPTIVIDLDETILYRRGGFWDFALLYAFRGKAAERVGVPYPSAVSSITHLSSRYRFVAVTARMSLSATNTQGWLLNSGLPEDIPVIFAKAMHPRDQTRVAYKAAAVAYLRDEGWNPILGVGDRPSDLEAYAREGLRCFMVAHKVTSKEQEEKEARAGCIANTDGGESATPHPSDGHVHHPPHLPHHRGKGRSVAAAAPSKAGEHLRKLVDTQLKLQRAAATSSSSPLRISYFTDDEKIHDAVSKVALQESKNGSKNSVGGSSSSSSSNTSGEDANSMTEKLMKHETLHILAQYLYKPQVISPIWTQIRDVLETEDLR